MFTNNKAQASTGWSVIFFLLILLPLSIIFIVFNQVMTDYINPTSDTLIAQSPYLNASDLAQTQLDNKSLDNVWYALPIVVFIALVVWLLVTAMKRRPGDY